MSVETSVSLSVSLLPFWALGEMAKSPIKPKTSLLKGSMEVGWGQPCASLANPSGSWGRGEPLYLLWTWGACQRGASSSAQSSVTGGGTSCSRKFSFWKMLLKVELGEPLKGRQPSPPRFWESSVRRASRELPR